MGIENKTDSLWNKEIFKKEILEKFLDYRNNYIDDLPDLGRKLLPSDENYYKYKCRGNFFIGIRIDLFNLIDEGILKNEEVINNARDYMQFVADKGFGKTMTTKDDIERVNEILDIVIKELQK